jgi:hypothetical protein
VCTVCGGRGGERKRRKKKENSRSTFLSATSTKLYSTWQLLFSLVVAAVGELRTLESLLSVFPSFSFCVGWDQPRTNTCRHSINRRTYNKHLSILCSRL